MEKITLGYSMGRCRENFNGTSDWSTKVTGIVPLLKASINVTNNKTGIDDNIVVTEL